jgi:hypothetical protein
VSCEATERSEATRTEAYPRHTIADRDCLVRIEDEFRVQGHADAPDDWHDPGGRDGRHRGFRVMNALSIIPPSNLPPARSRLVEINLRLEEAARRLEVLQSGRGKLESELSRVSEARAELDGLIQADAQSLADLVRSGASYVLNRFAGSRAQSLSARLSDSRLEAEVGSKALAAIGADIEALQREIAKVKLDAPSTATKICAMRISPVSRSMTTGTVSPA